ncbi:MAG TPA: hypothetical protein V6D14_15330 [Coleofasciculaceae cyanobacterium]
MKLGFFCAFCFWSLWVESIRYSQEQLRELVGCDRDLAIETIDRGLPVVPFWSDRIHQRLRENLRSFEP